MSISVLGTAEFILLPSPSGTANHPSIDSLVSREEIHLLAAAHNLSIPQFEASDWSVLLSGLTSCAKSILELPDYHPTIDLSLCPRTEIHRPEGDEATDHGGWAWKCRVECTAPKSDLLKGKTVAVKDNIAVAGVKCTNGTGAVDWTPNVDATLVTRILDAGGIITGKAACENDYFGAVSDTSVTGPVHNPYAHGYSTGCSSSGSARLLASGAVDLAIGADQGGLEATIDHAGPIARNVLDCATLLEVITGADGIDDRQQMSWSHGGIKYADEVRKHIAEGGEKPLKGYKTGVLKEGFEDPMTELNVAAASRAAIQKLGDLGAEIREISIPLHRDSGMIWMVALPMAGKETAPLPGTSGTSREVTLPGSFLRLGARRAEHLASRSLPPDPVWLSSTRAMYKLAQEVER